MHSFLIMPQCPMALLGRDLLSKLGVFITIPHVDTISIFCMQMAPRQSLSLSPHLPLDIPTLDPQVWHTDHPSIAKHHPPVHIILKDPSTIITQQQYSLTPEAHKGLKPIIDRLLQASILIPTHSPHNTPILAVKKGPNSWRLVQDRKKINEAIMPTFPVVPNPYTLLSVYHTPNCNPLHSIRSQRHFFSPSPSTPLPIPFRLHLARLRSPRANMDSSPPGVQGQSPLFWTGFTKGPTDTRPSPESSPPIRR